MCELFDINTMDKSSRIAKNIVIGKDVNIGKHVLVGMNVIISGDSEIMDDCVIESNSHIENAKISSNVKICASFIKDSSIDENSTVGPFANIRNNSIIGKNCRIGNFVEIKNSKIGDYSKCAHLTYVGDALIGENCNIGCGVVFCNYDGEKKSRAIVGDYVFIGSNSNIIAPIQIADKAYIAAGSTINKDIKEEKFAIARARQENKSGFNNPYTKRK